MRLLFSWERMQSQLWGSVPDPLPGYAQYFANFKQIVDYATSLSITVIIEPWPNATYRKLILFAGVAVGAGG